MAGSNFQSAESQLQAWFVASGTYAGAELAPGTGVTVVRADTAGYCLQDGVGTAAHHLVGPGGQPQPGSC